MRKLEILTAGAAMVIAAGLALAMPHAAPERAFPLALPELKMNCFAGGGQYVIVGNGGARACIFDDGVIAPAPAGSSMP